MRAVSTSSQGEAVVPLDARGRVLGPAIVSFDGRTTAQRDEWAESYGAERLFQITGMPLHTMYSLLKIQWLRAHTPEMYRQVAVFLPFGDFVLRRLGAPSVTDESMAARTMAFDLSARRWSSELLDHAEVEETLLPAIHPSGVVVGTIDAAVARDLGLPPTVRLVTGAHDQPAGALGAGITTHGLAMDATGTVECVCPAFAEPILSPEMLAGNYCCYPHAAPGLYVTIAFNFTGGALLRWYRDQFGRMEVEEAALTGLDTYDILMARATSRPSGVLVLPHFTVAGTPWFDTDARGAIVGLTLATTRQEVFQGLLDGITFEMRLNLDRLEAAGVAIHTLRAVGGGARSRTLAQIKANVFRRPVQTMQMSEAPCFGAALLAGQGVGAWTSLAEAAQALVRVEATYEPNPTEAAAYEEWYSLYQRLYPAFCDLSHQIAALQQRSPPP